MIRIVLIIATSGCGTDIEERLADAREEGTPLISIRNCTCASSPGKRSGYVGYDKPWPAIGDCHAENVAGLQMIEESVGNAAIVIEHLLGYDYFARYWFVEADGTAEFYHEVYNDVFPSGGWESEVLTGFTVNQGASFEGYCEDEHYELTGLELTAPKGPKDVPSDYSFDDSGTAP